MRVIKKNSSGGKVVDIQRRLKLLGFSLGKSEIDGIYGIETEEAIKRFQQDRGLLATGMVDQETWQELVDAGYKIGDRMLYLKYPPFRGDDVKTLQFWLKTLGFYQYNENGIFCEATQKALVEFQRNMNIPADGIVGKGTLQHLKNLKMVIMSRKTSNFPLVSDYKKEKKLEDFKIILDYGGYMNDVQSSEKYYREKIYICRSIIDFCEEMLVKNGIKTVLTVNDIKNQSLFLFDRIDYANKSGGDIIISVNLNYSIDKDANGSSCFYFKGFKSYSIAGEKIATLIQDKLLYNLKLLDCRVHGAGYAILKETSMTSVLVEPAFISNVHERENLKKSSYQMAISKCIAEAVIEYLRSSF